jgi:hypothetical protein
VLHLPGTAARLAFASRARCRRRGKRGPLLGAAGGRGRGPLLGARPRGRAFEAEWRRGTPGPSLLGSRRPCGHLVAARPPPAGTAGGEGAPPALDSRGERAAAPGSRDRPHRPGWPCRGAHPQRPPRGPRSSPPRGVCVTLSRRPRRPRRARTGRPQRRGHTVHEDRRPQQHGHPVHEDRRPQRYGHPAHSPR